MLTDLVRDGKTAGARDIAVAVPERLGPTTDVQAKMLSIINAALAYFRLYYGPGHLLHENHLAKILPSLEEV